MDEEATLLPQTALTIAGHAHVLAQPAAAARVLDATRMEGSLSGARWALLFITIILGVLDLVHNILLLASTGVGIGAGTERGKGTGTGSWLKWRRKKEKKSGKDEPSLE